MAFVGFFFWFVKHVFKGFCTRFYMRLLPELLLYHSHGILNGSLEHKLMYFKKKENVGQRPCNMKRFSKAINFPRCFAGTFDHCDLVISSEISRIFEHIHHLVILNHLKQLYYQLLSDHLSNQESL